MLLEMEVIKQTISSKISERLEEGNNSSLEQFASDFVHILYVRDNYFNMLKVIF